MWELWAFRRGSTVGFQQCLLWIHPRMVPGELRPFQDLQLSSPGVEQCNQNQPINISSHTQKQRCQMAPSDGDREQKSKISPGISSLKHLILLREPAATDLQILEELWVPWMF